MSQSELARWAGVSQPVISAYERGHREPGMATLSKLVEATGHHLRVEVVPQTDAGRGLPDTPMGRRLRRRRQALTTTAGRRGASNLRVFGSVARGEDTEDSDIDLLVDLSPNVGLVAWPASSVSLRGCSGGPSTSFLRRASSRASSPRCSRRRSRFGADCQRVEDVSAAMNAITSHLSRGRIDDELVFDAVPVRLIEIGEAIKDIDGELLAREADVPWRDIARMRDHLTHRYFDTAHSVVAAIENDLPPLAAAVRRLIDGLTDEDGPP